VTAVFKHWPILFRGSAIGTFIGAVPGVGGTVASFLSYASTVQISKEPETFGKGNIQGVIAPEAANNAKDGGALLPTLAFGIPGSAEMALFLGVLIIHGMEPGPLMLIEQQDIIFSLIFALLIACIFASAIGILSARWLSLITLVDVHVLVPVVISISLVGVYALHSSIGDIVLAGVFGVVGFLMIRYDYPRITLVIALVLGELAERNYHMTIAMGEPDELPLFFTRGISLGLLVFTAFILILPVLRLIFVKRDKVAGE
jgi:putative tricarboxylic transport membrane protein